jgi:hypothetical protein
MGYTDRPCHRTKQTEQKRKEEREGGRKGWREEGLKERDKEWKDKEWNPALKSCCPAPSPKDNN